MTERVVNASWVFRREFWILPWPRWEHRARCPICGLWLLVKRGRVKPDVPSAFRFCAEHMRDTHDTPMVYSGHSGWG